jgi:hypothetical protein
MKQFEDDLVDAFRLIPTFGMAHLAEQFFREQHKDKLNWAFCGLLPSQDTPEQRESTKHTIWPPSRIRHLIDRTGTKTMGEFLDRVVPTMEKHLNKQVFVLLTTALDSYLDRMGYHGTLGRRFNLLKDAKHVPADLGSNMQEVIQRRNDIAHGGVVSQDYISGIRYPGLMLSEWVCKYGVPASTGIAHRFDIEYLYWSASVMYDLGNCC